MLETILLGGASAAAIAAYVYRRKITDTFSSLFGTHELTSWGKFWLAVGMISLAAAAWMTFEVGWHMTAAHALFLACLSIVTAFAPETAYRQWEEGKKGVAVGISLLCVPLFAIEFFQHAAYTAGIRGKDIVETRVQNTKADDSRDTVNENKAQLAFWQKRLDTLTTQNGWTATVTADALRAKLNTADLAIKQEEARGGCKSKCLDRTKERDELKARIAVLEEASDLSKKIEHAKTVIAGLRDKAATTEHKTSVVNEMNAFLVKAVALTKGDTKLNEYGTEATQQSANIAIAFAGTGLPALAFFMSGLYRRKRPEQEQDAAASIAPHVERLNKDGSTYVINSTDPSVAAKLAALRDAFANVGQPRKAA